MSTEKSDKLLVNIQNERLSFFTPAGEVKALNDVSITLREGEVLGIVGESGSGKSVTSYSIMGITADPGRLVGGTIEFNGHHIEQLSEKLEYCVDSLSNSKDRHILRELNAFPVLDPHAHTAPFHNKYWNMAAGIVFPIGLNLIFRMARFRRRLRRDLRQIITTGEKVSEMCKKLS